MGEWMYRSTFSWTRQYLEVSGQLHSPTTLPPGKEPSVPIGYEFGWTPQSVWTTWRRENSWPYGDSNSNPSVVQPIASCYTGYALLAHNNINNNNNHNSCHALPASYVNWICSCLTHRPCYIFSPIFLSSFIAPSDISQGCVSGLELFIVFIDLCSKLNIPVFFSCLLMIRFCLLNTSVSDCVFFCSQNSSVQN
jgi:hypothetical protein